MSLRAPFIYTVMMKSMNDLHRRPIASFDDKNDAYLFVESKCENDNTINDNDLFFIFNDQQLIDTANRVIISHRKKKADGSNGTEKGAEFQPTPLQTRPTPPGGPRDCWVEKDDIED